MPESLLVNVNTTEIKSTMSLLDVLKELEVLRERLGYELKSYNLRIVRKSFQGQ